MRMCKSNHENELTHITVSKLMLFGIFRVCKEIKLKPKFTKMRSDLCRYFLVQCFNHYIYNVHHNIWKLFMESITLITFDSFS